MTTPALEFQNVALSFGGLQVLKNVSFTLREGQSLVIVGPSGAGKSVILKLAAGLLIPKDGQIRLFGKTLAELAETEAVKTLLQVGMLFQKNALFDSLTVFENVAFPLRERSSMSENQIRARCQELLTAVGLDHAQDLFPHEISGGMQKRLGVARALALQPRMIFYDDPTAGLDPITSRKIASLLTQLSKKHGTSTITITNDMMRALQMADLIGFVWNQQLQIIGPPDQAKTSTMEPFRSFFRGLPLA